MQQLRFTVIIMALLLSTASSALADGEMGFPKSESKMTVSASTDGVVISDATTEGEMGFPKSDSTTTISIIEAILGLF